MVVSITTLDLENEASTTISEADGEIMLLLTLSRSISQPLRVNLSSVGAPGLARGVQSPVDVLANMTTHQFTVSDIDDLIVAQPDRNIRISVASGNGYTPSTDSVTVTVNVIDDDTATVSISPARSTITAGDNAEFDVVLGLETAVNIDIEIDVEYGGSFITDQERVRKTVTVSANQTRTSLIVPTMENMGIAENSSLVATLATTSHSDLTIGDPSSATVIINALSALSITAMPTVLSLEEGGASTEINVSLNRIPAGSDSVTVTVTIDPTAGSGLTVSDLPLVFTGTETRTVTVEVPSDGSYTGDRNATLTLTATGYTMETVTIRILDNGLVVTVTAEPDGESSISVNEDSDVNLVINVDPSVPNLRDLDVNLSYMNITNTPETTSITVFAGNTSQSFSIPAGNDEIAAQSTRTFNVLIEPDISSYVVGASSSVTVSVLNEDSAVVSILPLTTDSIEEGTTALFEVQVDNAIATTLIATIDLTTVGGDFGINLDDTDVVIVAGETTALLTVATGGDIDEVDGSLTASIISLTPRVPVSGVRPTFDVNPATVMIRDNDLLLVSITTLENEASTTISEADDNIMLRLTLSRAISQPLQVNLNSVGDSRLAARVPTVVEVSSNTATQDFTVTINDMIVAQPDRNIAISVATGVGYTASTTPVTVNVIDNDTATVSILPVRTPITAGENAEFEVVLELETAVDIEIGIDVGFGGGFIRAEDRRRTTVTVSANQTRTSLIVPTMENTGMEENSSLVATLRAIPHRALTIGAPLSARVEINALDPLSITAMPTVLSLEEGGASTEINVSLNRIPAGSDSVTVTVTIDPTAGSGLTVSTTLLMFSNMGQQQPVTVAVPSDGSYTGDRNATLTLTATGYTMETVTIRILDNGLVVTVTAEPDGESSISVNEDSDVNLVINVDPSVPNLRDLDVNLSYMNITDTLETTSITVFAGNTSQSFSIPAGNDEIAAQSTRTFNVLIEPDISSYVVGASSSVTVSVLNEDSAVVSILPLTTDSIEEGTTALFEVQVDNAIATTLIATIDLTTVGGDFGINLDDTDVVIVAGETTALLTVATGGDIDEVDGSLTASIISLTPRVPVSGVRPTFDVNPATVMIRDNDLLLVSITTLENEASTTISEADDNIMLRLTLSRAISQPLQVNLNSVGDSRLAARVPTVVEVSSNTATQDFTVTINDMIVAQPDRNIAISVATGVGYTASTTPVTVNVIDNDTAAVSILPARTPITAGDDAEFEVVLEFETAVDIDIGINVEYGGVFITNRDRTTVTVSAGQTSVLLTVQTIENTGMEENSSLVATLAPLSHSALTIGDPSSATVIINALDPLSIIVDEDMLSLVEDGASTDINVSLNRIPADRDSVNVTATVTSIPPGSGLTVSTTLLTFTGTETQTVTVTPGDDYSGMATLIFTATDYESATVTVDITAAALRFRVKVFLEGAQ